MGRNRRAPPSAKARAVDLLSRREHGRPELLWKLLQKEHPRGEAEAALDALEDLGLLNDLRAAQGLARYYAELRGYGPRRLQQVLTRERRLPSDLVDQAIESLERDFSEACLDAARRKGLKGSERKDEQRLLRYLVGRGYTPSQAYAALDIVRAERADEDTGA